MNLHYPTQLFDATGIIPDPRTNQPINSPWYYHIKEVLANRTSVFPNPNPVEIARHMPHPTTIQISRYQLPIPNAPINGGK